VAKTAVVNGRAVNTLANARLFRVTGARLTSPSAPSRSVQSVRCQWYRDPRRRVLVTWVEPLSRLCVLMCSILPGLRSTRTWPAQLFQNTFLVIRLSKHLTRVKPVRSFPTLTKAVLQSPWSLYAVRGGLSLPTSCPWGPWRKSHSADVVLATPTKEPFERNTPCNLRTSIASESVSVYKPAHAHVHRNAQREEGKQHRRSTVTHKG
jgi:hypothetical protein